VRAGHAWLAFLAIILAWGAAARAAPAAARPVIIDSDMGPDDALAVLLALNSPELDVRAITVVPGNVTAEQGLKNALALASLAGRCNIPVAAGAQRPLLRKLVTADYFVGANGLGNVELPPSRCHANPRFASDLIIGMIHAAPHELTLITIGPLTNVALAVEKDSSIVPLVKQVVMMGGSISGGNVTGAAEYNIWVDPEAAQVVFRAGWPIVMVGLDVGNRAVVSREDLAPLERTHGPENDAAVAILKFLLDLEASLGWKAGAPLFDPLAVAVAVDHSIVTTEPMRVDVETRGEFTRGETVANRQNEIVRYARRADRDVMLGLEPIAPNAQVCTRVNVRKFLALFLSRLEGK
jgi:inosine-uridine nucleoside N-ribohydrolase